VKEVMFREVGCNHGTAANKLFCGGLSKKQWEKLVVIVISEFLERHSNAKRTRAPAYSRAVRRIKGVVQRVVRGKLRYAFKRVRGDRVAVNVDVV